MASLLVTALLAASAPLLAYPQTSTYIPPNDVHIATPALAENEDQTSPGLLGHHEAPFAWDVGVGSPKSPARTSVLVGGTAGSQDRLRFEVPEGATSMRIEADWTCQSVTCGGTVFVARDTTSYLVPGLVEEGVEPVGSATGSGKAAFDLEGLSPGAWLAWVEPDGASATASGLLSIDVMGTA